MNKRNRTDWITTLAALGLLGLSPCFASAETVYTHPNVLCIGVGE